MKQAIKKIIFCTLTILVSIQSFAIKPDRVYRFYPEKLCLIHKDLEVTTVDDIKIKVIQLPENPYWDGQFQLDDNGTEVFL